VAVAAGWFCQTGPARAGGALFDEVQKDFGSVPRGTTLTHQFRLNNPTSAQLHVGSLRTSCGCATVAVGKDDLAPGESTVLAVTIDTRKYSGPRTFTINVMIERPFVQEVRLTLQATSRDDVTLTPGQLAYGKIKKGTGAKGSVNIEYHGTGDWRITAVENDNGYLQPQLDEVSRLPGHVIYQLAVKLREDLPVGAWHHDLWLKTNDSATPRIRVPIIVEVDSNLTVTPAEVVMGNVKTGTQAERKIVIRGTAPFKITGLQGADNQFQISGQTDEAKPVHVLKITLTAGQEPAACVHRFKVLTDLPQDSEVEFAVQAQVVH
jgi:hypothetical protein